MLTRRIFLVLTATLTILTIAATRQSWSITTFSQAYAGSGDDSFTSVEGTSDGGLITAGFTNSFGAGSYDFWVVKLDEAGAIEWQKAYGTTDTEWFPTVKQVSDGGFIVAGRKEPVPNSVSYGWVLKLDPLGNIQWQKTYGNGGERIFDLSTTADGGFVITGQTGSRYLWVLKADVLGAVQWSNRYGKESSGTSVRQVSDGGYIVAADTPSYGAGGFDAWVLKLDAAGDIQWQKAYGGPLDDSSHSIRQTTDGGYVMGGETLTFSSSPGYEDLWLLKLDAAGGIVWQRSLRSGSLDQRFPSLRETADGGFIMGAETANASGRATIWVAKFDATGATEWERWQESGGRGPSVTLTPDGGYAIVSAAGDGRVLKVDANGDAPACLSIPASSVTSTSAVATATLAKRSRSTTQVNNTFVATVDTTATVTAACP